MTLRQYCFLKLKIVSDTIKKTESRRDPVSFRNASSLTFLSEVKERMLSKVIHGYHSKGSGAVYKDNVWASAKGGGPRLPSTIASLLPAS